MPVDVNAAKAIFMAALEKIELAERAAYVGQACGSDDALRQRVEILLKAHDEPGTFMKSSAGPTGAVIATVDEQVTEGPSTVIGPYKLMEQIGEGGMGLVFVAEQQHPVRRKVALKVIKPGMDTRQVIARFEAERQALALMDHPNIARVYDGGETASGRPYFVMELVKGVPITEYCDQNQVPIRERLELFLHVCQAVQHAHQKGIIHRDIKPSNVLVMYNDGTPLAKVIDFGVAKAVGQQLTDKTIYTQFTQLIGTPLYMSPEQAGQSGVDVDTRSDIYSLGVLLYELLTGTTPFDPERLRTAGYDEMRRIIREEEPPKPSTRVRTLGQAATTVSTDRQSEARKLSSLFRGELDWIVVKALEKDRNRRYETANGFAMDVQCYLADEPVQACPPSARYRLGKFTRRNKTGLVIAGLVLFFTVLLGGGVGWVVRDRAAQQAEMKRQVQDLLGTARDLLGENQVARARQKLAEANSRIGDDRALFGSLVDQVETLDTELGKFERFMELVDQAHEAEFPQTVALALRSEPAGGTSARPDKGNSERDPAKAIPYLLAALSCYGILEQEDWSARLEGGPLGPEQMARVRRTTYEELLWLANDLAKRRVQHRSGRKMPHKEAAEMALAYLAIAESALRPTTAFYQIRGFCQKVLGKEEEARKNLEMGRRASGAIALDHYLLAQAAYDVKNKAEAVQQCEAALRVEPTHYWSLLLLGGCLCDLGSQKEDYQAAAVTFTGCILKRPDHAQAYANRALAYRKLHRTEEAVADCQEALRLQPDSPAAHGNLGLALGDQGKWSEAEKEYREAVRLQPNDPLSHDNLGILLCGPLGRTAEAETEFREALRLQPNYPSAHHNLGVALRRQGKSAEAEKEYREALRLESHLPQDVFLTHKHLGIALSDQGKWSEAEKEYREALRRQPDDPETHEWLGIALNDHGKHAEAEKEHREALRLQPDFPDAHNNLGIALADQGKLVEAEKEYREALRQRSDFLLAHDNLFNVLGRQGKFGGEMEAEIREVLRLWPHNPLYRYNLGVLLSRQRKYAEAEAAYREALRLRPDYAEAHCNLGKLLLPQGRFAEALGALKRGHELGSKQPNWRHPSAEWVDQAEQLAAFDAKLPQILEGLTQPSDAAECLGLAQICQVCKKRYATASRFYTEAFAADLKLAADTRTPHRYNAACAAALAGCGQGEDAAKLDDNERARLRRQALDWLRADLAASSKLLEREPDKARATVQETLRHWQQDTDFAGVRGDLLGKLPEAERQAWRKLWADVEKTLIKVNDQDTKELRKKSSN
jgi:serine/threonine protein kinase/Flp pilus assembly protein TadD